MKLLTRQRPKQRLVERRVTPDPCTFAEGDTSGAAGLKDMKYSTIHALLCLCPFQLASASVLAIDFGTEWTKAALVKQGIPLEIVLTKDTKRKEQSVIGFKGNERLYGQDAANLVCLHFHFLCILLK